MAARRQQKILKEYDAVAPQYSDLASVVRVLMEQLLTYRQIPFHSVTCRAKESESLARKLAKSDREYTSLQDLHDLAGVRIITYFEPDVDRVAKMVEEEFSIDWKNSSDKRTLLDPDRFGYLSVHYVVILPVQHVQLAEYARFSNMRFEIQIRSVLQHAWAEIEHDLGYKSKLSVPHNIRRRFSRVAGLLELADAEFSAIRSDLLAYERTVSTHIELHPDKVALDKASLMSFIRNNQLLHGLDKAIAKAGKARIAPPSDSFAEYLLQELHFMGFKTIADLENALAQRAPVLQVFSGKIMDSEHVSIPAGLSLGYLTYVLMCESGDLGKIRRYLDAFNLESDDRRDEFAEKLLSSYKAAQSD